MIILILLSVICGIIWLKSIDKEGTVSNKGKIFGWSCILLAGFALYSHSENSKFSTTDHSDIKPIHFGSSDGFRHYPCKVGGCLCTSYEAKGIYNSFCNNCGHPKHKSKYD